VNLEHRPAQPRRLRLPDPSLPIRHVSPADAIVVDGFAPERCSRAARCYPAIESYCVRGDRVLWSAL